MPSSMNKHCNAYGGLAFFTAVAAAISWLLVNQKACQLDAYNTLQLFHIAIAICGIVLFVLAFFNFAGIIYDTVILFYAAFIAILVIAVVAFYAAYVSFRNPCMSAVEGLINIDIKSAIQGKDANIFSAEDPAMITVFVLDLLAGLLLLSASGAFHRRA